MKYTVVLELSDCDSQGITLPIYQILHELTRLIISDCDDMIATTRTIGLCMRLESLAARDRVTLRSKRV